MIYHVTFTPPKPADETRSVRYRVAPDNRVEPALVPGSAHCRASLLAEAEALPNPPESPPLKVEVLQVNAPPVPSVVCVGGQVLRLALTPGRADLHLRRGRQTARVRVETELSNRLAQSRPAQGPGRLTVRSPLPGRVLALAVAVGDRTSRGSSLLTIEAMKMENEILAPTTGRVASVHVAAGDTVDSDAALVEIHPD